MEWGSRPQGKNGWVATSCLGKKKSRQTLHCLCTCTQLARVKSLYLSGNYTVTQHVSSASDKIKVWFDGQ